MKIFFYNHWHNGDIHNSRTFIREIVHKNPQHDFTYLHYNSKRLLLDIENLKYQDIKEFDFLNILSKSNIYHDKKEALNFEKSEERKKIPQPFGDGSKLPIFIKNDACFINTWVGSYPQNDNIYKRHLFAFKRIFNIFDMKLEEDKNWCPEIDFQIYSTEKIKEFLESKSKLRILVCNGDSMQADDFNFKEPLEKLIKEHDFELILTSKKDKIKDAIYTEDLTERSFDDLNEISLISTSCDVIIGRSSGPSSYCIVKDNQLNERKVFINFITIDDDENFDLNKCEEPKRGPFFLKHSKAKFLFSNDFSEENIFRIIQKEIT